MTTLTEFDVDLQVAEWFRELTESFNYGLFMPPFKGKAGKFLDEERRLSEYPFADPLGCLELKYKRRVYKMLQIDEKQLKNMNNRSSHKKFLDHVRSGNVEKVTKMCDKGLDPNFHCLDSGETPLSLAAGLKSKSVVMLKALVNGGAILDFRGKDGSTAVHVAVLKQNVEAMRTLLDLGASPNYKDAKGLTPLYLSTSNSVPVELCELLLQDHAQACKNGLVQHLERLIAYSANLNAQNASGNTPLHVCAVNNQEACARILLMRGADKSILNFAGQAADQTAVIANNLELAEVIQQHKPQDVVLFKEVPKFNPRRRGLSGGGTLSRSASDATSIRSLDSSSLMHRSNLLLRGSSSRLPPSPSPSDRSLPPFSSGSSISETSTGSGGSTTIGSSSGAGSSGHARVGTLPTLLTDPTGTVRMVANSTLAKTCADDEQLDSASALVEAVFANDANAVEVLSLSSGVGTSSSQSGSAGGVDPGAASILLSPLSASPSQHESHDVLNVQSGTHVVCVESFSSKLPGTLRISQGDVIEVTGSTDDGMLEGVLKGQSGVFPAASVTEVKLRHPDKVPPGQRVQGRRDMREGVNSASSTPTATTKVQQQQIFEKAMRSKAKLMADARVCVLHKGRNGFGFVLRGAKAASPLMEMIPSEKCPGLQYMDDVDVGGVADKAGIKKGDFLLKINDADVTQASHEKVVQLIRKAGDLVALTVVTVPNFATGSGNDSHGSRQCSTLPKRFHGRPLSIANVGQLLQGTGQPPPPPKRDPTTTLSVGRAKAKSMLAGKDAIEALDRAISLHDHNQVNGVGGSKVYSSVSEMKRAKANQVVVSAEVNDIRKDLNSYPEVKNNHLPDPVLELNAKNQRMTQDDQISSLHQKHNSVNDQRGYFTLPSRNRRSVSPSTGSLLPPPDHPPPPIPIVSNIVSLDPKTPDYATVNRVGLPKTPTSPTNPTSPTSPSGVKSSFKPSDNAKLYASPENIQPVLIRSKQEEPAKKRSPIRTQSMPPRPNRPQVLRKSMIVADDNNQETYSINGVSYTTYTTFRSPITPDEYPGDFGVSAKQFDPDLQGQPSGDAEPHIPEPDYDLSDSENGPHSSSRRGSSTTVERQKKKKSVSFVMNEEMAAKLQAGKMTRQESILKDPSRSEPKAPTNSCHHQQQPQESPKLISEKYSRPIERIPQASLKLSDSKPMPANLMHQQQVQAKASMAAPDKIRIAVPDPGSQRGLGRSSSVCDRHQLAAAAATVASANASGPAPTLQKSQSFSADKTLKALGSTSSSTGISESDLKRARSQLKPSRSFPNELVVEEGENSSSGVSSDQEVANDGGKFVTYIPSDSQPTQSKAVSRWENVSESSDDVSEKSWILRAEQDLAGGNNIVSMKQMLHPKLQAIFDQNPGSSTLPSRSRHEIDQESILSSLSSSSSSGSGGYTSKTLPSRGNLKKNRVNGDPRSIPESLALIKQNVNDLNHVNQGTAVDSPAGVVLAPPPGFTDSDNEGGRPRRFDPRSIEEQERLERRHAKARENMSRSMDFGHSGKISHVMTNSFEVDMPRRQVEYKGKALRTWSAHDVCDWLDSLFMPEYKPAFLQAKVDGAKLTKMSRSDLESLGVVRLGHVHNIEKSLKRYL